MLLVLIMAMVGGATFALFSDQSSNQPNVLSAGTLDIGVPGDNPNEGSMKFEKAAPGDSYEYSITVNNKGTLPFLYKVTAKRTPGTTANPDLFDILTVKVNNGQPMLLKDLKDHVLNLNMAAGTSEICKLTITLPLGTANAYQGGTANIDFVFDAQQVDNLCSLTNAGFELGDLTGWNIVSNVDGVTVVGNDGYTGPKWGSYMARLGTPGQTGQPKGANAIAQTFKVTSPQLTFAYNIFTHDYPPYDNFQYNVKVVADGTVVKNYSQTAWGSGSSLKTTGWQTVSVDLSAYLGQDVQVYVSAGGTMDNVNKTWAYFDTPNK